eukprot:GHVN01015930.1.p1 GENE.GHVN01015930.1~~GHVN01015930.1.p1  ORF type:complete len:101 (+),score=35.40 GHVN01015930.1:289-591(+)
MLTAIIQTSMNELGSVFSSKDMNMLKTMSEMDVKAFVKKVKPSSPDLIKMLISEVTVSQYGESESGESGDSGDSGDSGKSGDSGESGESCDYVGQMSQVS